MSDIITDCLGAQWAMFYIQSMPIYNLTSLQTLEKSLSLVNQNLDSLGKQLDQWVNWIYQRLPVEPIRKPILTHFQSGQYYVDCGDTRLMSLRLYNPDIQVPIIVTCGLNDVEQFSSFARIYDSNELKTFAGFSPDACVVATPAVDRCLYWLEIGDQSTTHHLHDINQRRAMIQQYINQQDEGFKFSESWATSSINWEDYQSTE